MLEFSAPVPAGSVLGAVTVEMTRSAETSFMSLSERPFFMATFPRGVL
nr:wsv312 [Shrimp white spot syndrome virus]AWQ63412.1 wsv312 [Shrimp white spot syndrome virus]AWQ63812.1 wsv312 [Shrimp white spot syndrome virus]